VMRRNKERGMYGGRETGALAPGMGAALGLVTKKKKEEDKRKRCRSRRVMRGRMGRGQGCTEEV